MIDVLDSCALCGVTSKLLALHGGLGLASIRAARAKLVGCWAPPGSFGLLLVAKCVTRARFLLLCCFCCYSCCCSYCWPRSDSFQACRIPALPAHHSVCHFACPRPIRRRAPGKTSPGQRTRHLDSLISLTASDRIKSRAVNAGTRSTASDVVAMAEYPSRRTSSAQVVPSIPPPPPLPPAKQHAASTRSYFTRFVTQPFTTYGSRPPSAQANRPDGGRPNPLVPRLLG